MIHYAFPKGVRLLIIMKDGSKLIDKYVEIKHRTLVLENGTIKYENIRSTTIYKGKVE